MLTKYFPPPKFLCPPHIGVSFSDDSIKAIFFDKSVAHPELKYLVVPLEKGAIVGGRIIDVEEVAKKLSSLKEVFDIPYIFFTLPDELAYIFQISIPFDKKSNIYESVAFTIEENVPLPLNDTTFDFIPLGTTWSDSDSSCSASLVVAACVKNDTEKFLETVRKSGFEPVGCVHESQAIADAIVPKNSPEISCIVHARKNRVGIYLVKQNVVHFSTLQTITDGDYEKQFMDEFEKFMEYSMRYNSNKGDSIQTIFICGEFEFAKKSVETILGSQNSAKDVKLANVWTNVMRIEKNLPKISFENSLNLAGPIGSVLASII